MDPLAVSTVVSRKDFHTRAFNTEFLRIPCGRFLRVIVARGHLERL